MRSMALMDNETNNPINVMFWKQDVPHTAMNKSLYNETNSPYLNTYIEDLQTQPSAVPTNYSDYYNIRPLEYELYRSKPDAGSYSSDANGVSTVVPSQPERPMWEKFLMALGAAAVVLVLFDGVTGAGIINL